MVAIVPLRVGRREAHLRRGPPDVRPLQEARLRPLAPHSSLAHFIPSARDAVECRPQGLRQGYLLAGPRAISRNYKPAGSDAGVRG